MDLGVARFLSAEAFGQPGRRTFRLLVEAGEGRVSLWMEKEQIMALGAAIEELLRRYRSPQGNSPMSDSYASFMGDLEVRVGSLSVGYDPHERAFRIEAGDFLDTTDLEQISFAASREQFDHVRVQTEEIGRGGRPRCPLCGAPMSGEPHFCPPSNGHADLTITD